ncbi:hypothetical protein [Nocardioides rubriscoriae]|uniref:hypothetical protein n=1 Tax=Nocardioides rubriscoriae TaxID=642762 RepID=UPI0011DF15DD|nr:hypothetical protein [Nocardioides rubriscoriae]
MSNRRKTSRQRQAKRATRPPADDHPLDGMMPWIWAMQDADEAERRGDAAAALAVIERRLLGPDGEVFWNPPRVRRLHQLQDLGSAMPRWVTSRWILAQAVQALDERDPAARSKRLHALDIARELSGAFGDEEWTASLMDHDWFYRQVLLYDGGALEDFVRRTATPDLVAGADRIADWAAASMGGYLYLGATCGRSSWTDLATGRVITLDDIGAASMLLPDLPVLGRLVPAGAGLMFESAPLEASLEVAQEVARHPAAWLTIVRSAGDVFRDGEIISHVDDFGLVTDVPRMQWLTWLSQWRPERARALQADVQLLARTVIDRTARELGQGTHRFLPEGEQFDDEEHAGWEPWVCLSAPLLEPGVPQALARVVTPADLPVLGELRDRVTGPARSLLARVTGDGTVAA